MAFITADRIKETATTTGTGAFTLLGAASGFKAFSSACVNGDIVYYCIAVQNGTDFEVGRGSWATGNILNRTTVISSSNANALVSFTASTKDVFLTAPAIKIAQLDDQNNITLPVATSIKVPVTGFLNVLVKNLAGRNLLGQIGPSGLDTAFQPHMGRNRCVAWQSIGNSTTAPIVDGILAPTTVGTATARNVATTNIATRIKRLGHVSVATAGGLSGHYFTVAQYTIGDGTGLGGFHFIERFVVSDAATVTGARQFIGMSSNITAPTNVEANTLTDSIGLAQLSTDATQWYIVYGGSTAQSAIALGTTIGAPTLVNTAWDFILFAPPNTNNTCGYMLQNLSSGVIVSGTLTGVAGTALSASTTLLAPRTWRSNNATALAVGIDIASIYIETDQ